MESDSVAAEEMEPIQRQNITNDSGKCSDDDDNESVISSAWTSLESVGPEAIVDETSEHEHSENEDIPKEDVKPEGANGTLLSEVAFPPLGASNSPSPAKTKKVTYMSITEAAAAAVLAAPQTAAVAVKQKPRAKKAAKAVADPSLPPLAMNNKDVIKRAFPNYDVPDGIRKLMESNLQERDSMNSQDLVLLAGVKVRSINCE